jgi:hypothetical protein
LIGVKSIGELLLGKPGTHPGLHDCCRNLIPLKPPLHPQRPRNLCSEAVRGSFSSSAGYTAWHESCWDLARTSSIFLSLGGPLKKGPPSFWAAQIKN